MGGEEKKGKERRGKGMEWKAREERRGKEKVNIRTWIQFYYFIPMFLW